MKKVISSLFLTALALVLVTAHPSSTKAGGNESYLASTVVVWKVTCTATNPAPLWPALNGYIPIRSRFIVSSGTLTIANVYTATNATAGGGSGTNVFYVGSGGSITYASGDSWQQAFEAPIQWGGSAAPSCIATASFGGVSASGLVTGTVNSVTLYGITVYRP